MAGADGGADRADRREARCGVPRVGAPQDLGVAQPRPSRPAGVAELGGVFTPATGPGGHRPDAGGDQRSTWAGVFTPATAPHTFCTPRWVLRRSTWAGVFTPATVRVRSEAGRGVGARSTWAGVF